MQTMIINNCEVELLAVRSKIFTTSLQIAEVFEKRHDNVLAKISELPSDEFTRLNFKVSEYVDSTGRKLPMYKITKDGFALLVMGFTGERAYKWKIEYIKAFNLMQEELLKRSRRKSESGQRAKIAAKNRKIALLKRQMAGKSYVSEPQKEKIINALNLVKQANAAMIDAIAEYVKERRKDAREPASSSYRKRQHRDIRKQQRDKRLYREKRKRG